MASVIFALGVKRTVALGSRTMIHRPWAGGISGEANDLRKSADLLDSLEKDLARVYAIARGPHRAADGGRNVVQRGEAVAIYLATTVFGKMSSAIPAEYLAKLTTNGAFCWVWSYLTLPGTCEALFQKGAQGCTRSREVKAATPAIDRSAG